jgi:hypothetical protein
MSMLRYAGLLCVAVVALFVGSVFATRSVRVVDVSRPRAVASAASELPSPQAAGEANAEEIGAEAVVVVTTTPPGAVLVLDGRMLSLRSPARMPVTAGDVHTLIARAPGHPGIAERFALESGEEATFEIDLRRKTHVTFKHAAPPAAHAEHAAPQTPAAYVAAPAPAPAPSPSPSAPAADGTLVLASSPWCTITVDGEPRGTTPLSIKLKPGAHEIVLANTEFKIKRTLPVEIAPNQTLRKSLDFAPE